MSEPVPSVFVPIALNGTVSPVTRRAEEGVTAIRARFPRSGGGPGGRTTGGPRETVSATSSPRRALEPASGNWVSTCPAGAGSTTCVSVPVPKPAPERIASAALFCCPTTLGTTAGRAPGLSVSVWKAEAPQLSVTAMTRYWVAHWSGLTLPP